jgi:hypothetical protein
MQTDTNSSTVEQNEGKTQESSRRCGYSLCNRVIGHLRADAIYCSNAHGEAQRRLKANIAAAMNRERTRDKFKVYDEQHPEVYSQIANEYKTHRDFGNYMPIRFVLYTLRVWHLMAVPDHYARFYAEKLCAEFPWAESLMKRKHK